MFTGEIPGTTLAVNALDKRPGVPVEEKARIEFARLSLLEQSEHDILNLEERIAEPPNLYAQAIAYVFKRADSGEDPPELSVSDPERHSAIARAVRRLFDGIRRIPGASSQGDIDAGALKNRIGQVRPLCAQLGCADIGDQKIGELLSRAPAGEGGVWPCLPICEVLEWMASKGVSIGFEVGERNNRGVQYP